MIKKFIFTTCLFFIISSSFAQEKTQIIAYDNVSLEHVLNDLKQRFGIHFSYESALIANKTINIAKAEKSLNDVLYDISQLVGIDFNIIDDNYIYLTKSNRQAISEIVVTTFLAPGISKSNDGSYHLDANKMEVLTGLTDTDILEGLQQLPGVVSINNTATGLNIKGGNIDENRIVFDGINIYHPGHLFGSFSVFNPNIAEQIRFITKGTNPEYSSGISSTILINSNSKFTTEPLFEYGISDISSDAVLTLPLLKNKLNMQVSFRRSIEDIWESPAFRKYEEQAFQHSNIQNENFHFKDYNVKLNYNLNTKNKLAFSLIHIDDDLSSETSDISYRYFDQIDVENDGYSLVWDKTFNKNIQLKTTSSYSHFRLDYNSKTIDNTITKTNLYKNNRILDYGVKTVLNITKKKSKYSIGYQFSKKKAAYDIIDNQNNLIFNLDNDNDSISTHSLFANHKLKLADWTVNYGLRTNYYSKIKETKFEPRLNVDKKINTHLSVNFTAEVKNQILKQINESVLNTASANTKLWRLTDESKHPIISGTQYTSGFVYTANNWVVDLDLYYKKTTGIAAFALGYLNTRDNTIHAGESKAKGLDLFVQKKYRHFNTWLGYSIMNAKNRFKGINNNAYFTASNNIKHAVTGAVTYSYHKKINFGLSWNLHTGKPLTDIDYNHAGGAYFDGINTETHPFYKRFDFSATYKFKFNKAVKGRCSFALKNIFDTRNYYNTIYSVTDIPLYTIHKTSKYSAGLLPNISLRLYW